MDFSRSSIGDRLRAIRGKRSQDEFANLLGISRKSLVRYEANERKPDVELITKLNLLYKVQPLWLLTGQLEAVGGEQLDPNESDLVRAYRQCAPDDQAVIRQMASRLAQPPQKTKKPEAMKS